MKYAYGSDAGRVRECNEDRVGVFTVADTFTVALLLDGMGGTRGGMIASRLAYETMVTELELRLSFLLCEEGAIADRAVAEVLRSACAQANEAVWQRAAEDPALSGMGTTLVAAVFYGDRCCILNVGDSRGYYLADHRITQITKDQSYLQYLLDHDKISQEQAADFGERNVIMSAVGTEKQVKSDLYFLTFQNVGTEYILLTSDGLHDLVSEQTVCEIVFEDISVKDKVIRLINGANESGGDDNISAVLLCNGG